MYVNLYSIISHITYLCVCRFGIGGLQGSNNADVLSCSLIFLQDTSFDPAGLWSQYFRPWASVEQQCMTVIVESRKGHNNADSDKDLRSFHTVYNPTVVKTFNTFGLWIIFNQPSIPRTRMGYVMYRVARENQLFADLRSAFPPSAEDIVISCTKTNLEIPFVIAIWERVPGLTPLNVPSDIGNSLL